MKTMMRKYAKYILLSAPALGLEAACWYPFFMQATPMAQQIGFLVLHSAGSIAGGALMTTLVPGRYRRRPWRTFALFFGFCLFVPVMGLAGLLLAVWPGIVMERHAVREAYQRVNVPDLPFQPLKVQKQPTYGKAGMISVLRHAQDPERRIKALIATRQMTSQEAIPVLKEALRDPVDDVRLLAYSMLDAKEEEINATIRRLLQRTDLAPADQRQKLHQRISNCYWELAYLGLAQGEVLRHSLAQALSHLEQALSAGADEPALYVQRGRLLMHQQRWDEAGQAFTTAVEQGIPAGGVAPYLAEIAFEKKNFQLAATYLRQLGPSVRRSERLAAVASYWIPMLSENGQREGLSDKT
jgi:polysaccharide biosynthesis protein PelE